MSGRNIGNMLNDAKHLVGMVYRWFRFDRDQSEWHNRVQAFDGILPRPEGKGRLRSPPSAISILRIDGESDSCASEFAERDRKSGDGANHQYDIRDFFAAVKAGNFPAVSFLETARLSGWTCRLIESAG